MEPSPALPVDPGRARRLVRGPRQAVYREPTLPPGPPAAVPEPPPAPLLDHPELAAMRAADAARDHALHAFNAAGKRRIKMYILASVIFLPLVTSILTPAGLSSLWLQIPIAILYGTFVALARPGPLLCSVTTVLAGLLIQTVNGTTMSGAYGFPFLLALFLYGTAGLFVGYTEQARQLDR